MLAKCALSSSIEISAGISALLRRRWTGAVCMAGRLRPSCSLLAGIFPSLVFFFFPKITFSFEGKFKIKILNLGGFFCCI